MKIRFAIVTALGALMMSESASALSCARPALTQTLEEAKSSKKIYHILVGRFVTEAVTPPRRRGNRRSDERNQNQDLQTLDIWSPKPPAITRSWFEGVSLANSPRRDVPLARFPVDIETSCIGPWCSSAPTGERDVIAFVESRAGQPPILRISPCPKWVFNSETGDNVQTIRQGLR